MNKRIEEARDKWNIVQIESASSLYKQLYGSRSLRLTLEQELVIKGNLSEMYVHTLVNYLICNILYAINIFVAYAAVKIYLII